MSLGEHLRPRFGVYAVRALVDGIWRNGVANLGKRPTFGKLQENFEVHLFDFAGDLYGKVLRVALVDFIRPEMKFSGLDALKAQIAADGQAARTLSRRSLTPPTPIPRLPALCLSGPSRSELSARSADRGRVVLSVRGRLRDGRRRSSQYRVSRDN